MDIHLSYDKGETSPPLLEETIPSNLKRIAQAHPLSEALVVRSQNVRFTYSAFYVEVEKAARSLIAMGLQKGDRLGIWSPNRFEWVILQYATAQVGVILVNINPAYRPTELQFALNQSGVHTLFMAKGFRKTNYIEILNTIKDKCNALRESIVLDYQWEEFMQKGTKISLELLSKRQQSLHQHDPINIQYTSGTTGFPKGATLSHYNILNNGYFIGERLAYTPQDRVCIPVPFYHCFGMVLGNLACTTHGSCMVIPAEFFDPLLVMQTVQEEKCTSLYGVPMMFIAELNHPEFKNFDFSTLRTGIMAGSTCPEKAMQQVRQEMNMEEVSICYGMTETSPVSTQTFLNDPVDKRVATVGKVHPHLEIKIIDPESGDILPRNQRGEFCTKGYSVMKGYWENEEASKNVIKEGWMHTGDLAEMDDDGYIKIVGRIKDMIIRGGENISPFEIEEYLQTHNSIESVQVIGVPDFKYGEEVMAWVKLKNGDQVSEENLHNYCKGQIATFKIPKYWKFVDDFPVTVTGKIRKAEMREISVKELELHGR